MNVNDFLISFAMSVYNGETTVVNTLKSLQNTILNFLEEKGRKISLTQQAKGNTNAYNYAKFNI